MNNQRLNKIKGQLNGIDRMIEEDRACMDIIQQIVAARAALSKLGVEILKDEARSCIKGGNGEKVQTLEDIIEKLFKIT